jgi:hypothetical protein
MSQNGPFPGPPWPGKSSDDEPYAEPADPWRDHAVAEPSWAATPPSIPHQSDSSFHSAPASDPIPRPAPSWGPTATAPRRNTPIVALVVVLGLLIVAGLGATGWLLKDSWLFQGLHNNEAGGSQPSPSVAATGTGTGTTQGSEDARFVTAGQCVINQGTNDQPDMRKSVCTTGTYEVLKVIKGKTAGEKDAENKCSKVSGYTNWFFYDSDLDDLDVVLCLKKQ